MKRSLVLAIAALGLALIVSACGDAVRSEDRLTLQSLDALDPGTPVEIQQDLTVNVVFVGLEPGGGPQQIDVGALLGGLPGEYRPQIRYKRFYGLASDMGLHFDYSYNPVFADATFEDDFFAYLTSIAAPMPTTIYQDAYNLQDSRELDITENAWVDGPSVERWLADNAGPRLGIDTSDYTVFFVNWYGRPDFQFHVITKTGEPDPDTGLDFGLARESRKLVAWGGTTPDDEETGLGSLHRIWFYDVSAGPEAWTENYSVDDADVDGDGVPDLRVAPIWEYGGANAGALPMGSLSQDLAALARYAAINLLFTSSPLYSPAISGPELPKDIELDVNVYQMDPSVDGTTFFDTPLIAAELTELQPQNSFSVEMNSLEFDGRVEQMYECFFNDVSCYGQRLFGIAFGDPYLYHQDKILQFLEGDADYEVPVFAWNATDDLFTCCLGYADDNWADGTQSFVFAFDAPFIRNAGYGFTTTTIHEVGHHVAMSHPHDGYDYELDLDYGPSGPTFLAWAGDESNTMMSYIDVNWDFSQFDRDNMARYMVAAYLNQANAILADIRDSRKAHRVESDLVAADGHAEAALADYASMAYESAALHAQRAYEGVLEAAASINVKVEPQASEADVKAKGRADPFVDEFDPNHKRFWP